MRGDLHPNPHIKALEAEPVDIQISKIDELGIAGCLYPTTSVLRDKGIGKDEPAPFTRALKEGEPQLSYRCFDLRALEWYYNDPRFDFDVDDIHGRILKKPNQAGEVVLDRLEFFEFGFAYNEQLDRVFAAFLRYLNDLPTDQQIAMKQHELAGEYNLHPDFYRTQILGQWPERISIYDAFLEERYHINQICELIGKPNLFLTVLPESKRPRGFGILFRPTNREFRAFSLLLDQLLSEDLNSDFFKGDLEMHRLLTDGEGNTVRQRKGTIQLLEEWIDKNFVPVEEEPLNEMYADFRAVRKARQKPAHRFENDDYDQKYVTAQRELIKRGFRAVRTLRMVLENQPFATSYSVPHYLREAKVWVM